MTYLMLGKRPLLPVLFALIAGVVLSTQPYAPPYAFLLSLFFVLGFFYFRVKRYNYRRIIILLIYLITGVFMGGYSSLRGSSLLTEGVKYDSLVKIENLKRKNNRIQAVATLNPKVIRGTILLNIPDTCCSYIFPGAYVELKTRIFKPTGPRRPGGFDYRKYLEQKGIDYIAYPRCNQLVSQAPHIFSFQGMSWYIQESLLSRIDKVFRSIKYTPLVKGILMGFKDEIAEEDRSMYARSGIGHVFAVSGMHVGMVYLFCFPLLFFRNHDRFLRFLLPIVALFLVWLFVLASGMTPSGVRAGLMISLYEIGKIFYRHIDKWNILALSALLAMVLQPLIIFDVGFQFSYLALIGIFLFYGRFIKLFVVEHVILKWIYISIAISFAAQITITPIAMYYFGNFSPYFWLASLLAMCIVQINFFLSLLGLVFPLNSWLSQHIANAVDYFFDVLHKSIEWIMTFDYAHIHWHPDLGEVLFIYSMLVFGLVLVRVNRKVLFSLLYGLGIVVFSFLAPLLRSHWSQPVLEIHVDEVIQAHVKKGVISTPIDSVLLHRQMGLLVGDKAVSLLNDKSDACPASTNILITDCVELSTDFLDQLCELNYFIFYGKNDWHSIHKIGKWCANNHVQFVNLNLDYAKINL